jgi:hypothetical protein
MVLTVIPNLIARFFLFSSSSLSTSGVLRFNFGFEVAGVGALLIPNRSKRAFAFSASCEKVGIN